MKDKDEALEAQVKKKLKAELKKIPGVRLLSNLAGMGSMTGRADYTLYKHGIGMELEVKRCGKWLRESQEVEAISQGIDGAYLIVVGKQGVEGVAQRLTSGPGIPRGVTYFGGYTASTAAKLAALNAKIREHRDKVRGEA